MGKNGKIMKITISSKVNIESLASLVSAMAEEGVYPHSKSDLINIIVESLLTTIDTPRRWEDPEEAIQYLGDMGYDFAGSGNNKQKREVLTGLQDPIFVRDSQGKKDRALSLIEEAEKIRGIDKPEMPGPSPSTPPLKPNPPNVSL